MATHHAEPVGFIIAEKGNYASLGDFTIVVRPAHRNKCLSSALPQAALNVFVNMGVRRVITDYLMVIAPAHNLYRELGLGQKRTCGFFMLRNKKMRDAW
jgi:GNAT superfamily N-acetyltransferase